MLENVLVRDHGYEWLDAEPLTIAAKLTGRVWIGWGLLVQAESGDDF